MKPRSPLAAVTLALVLTSTGCGKLIRTLAHQVEEEDAGGSRVATNGPKDDDDPSPGPPTTSTAAAPTATATATEATTARGAAKAAAASPAQLEKAFAALDINHDDQLDGIEVKSCGCAIADANGDGEITKAEYLAAGLLGKLTPGAVRTAAAPTNAPTNAPTPTQPTPPPPPAPVAGGLPPGSYKCFGLVGSMYSARGTLVIVDSTRYAHGTDGSGGGSYVFDANTKQIRFTSGLFADPNSVKEAKQISPTHIQMRTGKSGFYTWDCKR